MAGNFSVVVREKMAERGIGLRELCRAVGLDPSFFSKVLAEKRSPPSEEKVLRQIAEVLEMDAPKLVVSAGRIPQEWSTLWSDSALFSSVDALVRGGAGWEATRARRRREVVASSPAPFKSRDLGEELL